MGCSASPFAADLCASPLVTAVAGPEMADALSLDVIKLLVSGMHGGVVMLGLQFAACLTVIWTMGTGRHGRIRGPAQEQAPRTSVKGRPRGFQCVWGPLHHITGLRPGLSAAHIHAHANTLSRPSSMLSAWSAPCTHPSCADGVVP